MDFALNVMINAMVVQQLQQLVFLALTPLIYCQIAIALSALQENIIMQEFVHSVNQNV